MDTCRTFLGRLGTLMNITALGTVPDGGVLTLEDTTILQVGNKITVLFGMLLLRLCNGGKNGGNNRKPLFLGSGGLLSGSSVQWLILRKQLEDRAFDLQD